MRRLLSPRRWLTRLAQHGKHVADDLVAAWLNRKQPENLNGVRGGSVKIPGAVDEVASGHVEQTACVIERCRFKHTVDERPSIQLDNDVLVKFSRNRSQDSAPGVGLDNRTIAEPAPGSSSGRRGGLSL